MNPELAPLRDIHDALGNPWWPPAAGWWLGLLLLIALGALIRRQPRRWRLLRPLAFRLLGDWRWDAHRQLQQLQGPQAPGSVKARVAALSELLKRIAMARHGRHACAGLHGQAWLDWLSQHDPDGFDWRTQGQCLLQTAYAPEPSATAADPAVEQQLQRLLQATARWINVRPPKPRAPTHAPAQVVAPIRNVRNRRAQSSIDQA